MDELYFNPSASIPAQLREAIHATSDVDDCDSITYSISDLSSLLRLEIHRMITDGLRIKRCRCCGLYFVTDKTNQEYCSRVAPNSTKLCSDIGRSRAYGKKQSQSGSTPYTLYRTAYKTHFARVKNGKLSAEDFEKWKAEAAQKQKLTEAGEMGLAEYEQWLKQ